MGDFSKSAAVRIACLVASLAIAGLAQAQSSPDRFAQTIRAEMAAGQYGQADSTARRAIEQFPTSALLERLSGLALAKQGLAYEAINAFRRAVALDPSRPANYLDLGRAEIDARQDAAAARSIEIYNRLEPKNAEAHILLGRAELDIQEPQIAAAEFEKAAALSPQTPLVFEWLARAYEKDGESKRAVAAYKEQLIYDPECYEAAWRAGTLEAQRGRFADAQALFEQAIRIRPLGFEGHYGLGLIFLQQQKATDAIRELHRAVAIRVTDARAHQALAQAYHAVGAFGAEQRELLLAAQFQPSDNHER